MVGAGSVLGGNGPVVPGALPHKERICPNGEEKWENKVQTIDGRCHSGLGTPGKGLLDKGLAWKCSGPPSDLGPQGRVEMQVLRPGASRDRS